jgi:hypothetical protein
MNEDEEGLPDPDIVCWEGVPAIDSDPWGVFVEHTLNEIVEVRT